MAARWRADGPAVLLRAGDPIRESAVGRDVINLRSGLVVPGTPRHRGIDTNNRTLIAAEHHAVRIVRIDPELMKIVAGWVTFNRCPRLACITRTIDRGIHDIDQVRILWIGRNLFEVPAASPKTLVARESGPGYTRVIRAKYTAEIFGFGSILRMIFIVDESINDGVNAIVICRRH